MKTAPGDVMPDFEMVQSAAEVLAGHAHRTPVITSRTLNARIGGEVWFKCENLQRTGAFKFRGAFNALSRLDAGARKQGVLTFSSGNHAQAIAVAGAELGIRTVVVMPENVTRVKREATEGYGAEVVLFDPAVRTREAVAAQLQEQSGYTFIPPFDHPHVIAGQGTSAMEFLEDVTLDQLLVPCGGGGLLSGCAIAAKAMRPECRVIGIEPALADDARRSFFSGERHTVNNPPTIADGVRTRSLGDLTFPLIRRYVDDMQTVSETAIEDAVRFGIERMKMVMEPSGALGLAALLQGVVKPEGKTGILVSGGNVDAAVLGGILQSSG